MLYKNITCKTEEGVCNIVLNRPEDGNRINKQMGCEIRDACQHINQNEDILVVILSGSNNNFCSGGIAKDWEKTTETAQAVANINQVVIAAIDGDALGEGLELALACDIRIASGRAHFGMTQVARGLMPSGGGTQRLPRIVGRGKALEMVLTAAIIDSNEAFGIGLVSKVVPYKDLIEEATGLAYSISTHGPIALRYAKEAVNSGMELTLNQGLRLEADLYFLIQTSDDRREGLRAFKEKRPPDFKGK
jgi:enoyl-CoA hydratase